MKRPDFETWRRDNELQGGFDEIGVNYTLNECEAWIGGLERENNRYRDALADLHRTSAEALDLDLEGLSV